MFFVIRAFGLGRLGAGLRKRAGLVRTATAGQRPSEPVVERKYTWRSLAGRRARREPLTRIKIYLEDGGDYKDQKAALRLGMLEFLKTLKQKAAEKQIAFDVVICGGRRKAFEAFRYAFDRAHAEVLPLLVVDAEEALVLSRRAHLEKRDGWAFWGDIDENLIHLMTQVMETWIVADPETVAAYYTRHTQKGEYHKTRHAPDLLALIDESRVRTRCSSCDRLFSVLQTRIQNL
jgi:hypothetical protein